MMEDDVLLGFKVELVVAGVVAGGEVLVVSPVVADEFAILNALDWILLFMRWS